MFLVDFVVTYLSYQSSLTSSLWQTVTPLCSSWRVFTHAHIWNWKQILFILFRRQLCTLYWQQTTGSHYGLYHKKLFQHFYTVELMHIKVLKGLQDCISTYSWLSLSRPRLSRITAYLEVKIWSLPIHENLTTGGKYCRKEEKLLLRSNFSSFPQYFQYISSLTSKVQLPISLLNVVNRIISSSILQIWYVELRVSRSISESPLEFDITRVDCTCMDIIKRPLISSLSVYKGTWNDGTCFTTNI